MQITRGTPEGGNESVLGGTWIAKSFGTGPDRRFRVLFSLNLPTGEVADGVRFVAGTSLRLALPQLEFNALAADANEQAVLANRPGDAVQITLPVARKISRVRIIPAESADSIEAYRTDGDVISDEPFQSANHGRTGATLDVLDQRLVLKQKRGGSFIALRAAHLAEVRIRSAAANPRIGLGMTILGDELFYLAGDDGPLLAIPDEPNELGPQLDPLLNRLAARVADQLSGALLPPVLALQLSVESDTPFQVAISSFGITYRLQRRRFTSLKPKQVVSFGGAGLETQSLSLDVPRDCTIAGATIRVAGKFADSPSATGPSPDQPPSDAPSPASSEGVQLRSDLELATRVSVEEAALVAGCLFEAVAALANTRATVTLYADHGGSVGEPLATADTVGLCAGGERRLWRATFAEPALVSAGPAWLAILLNEGAATWLLHGAAEGRVAARPVGAVEWHEHQPAGRRSAVATLIPVSAGPGASPGQGVRLHVASSLLPGTVAGPDRQFDFTPQANQAAQQPATGPLAPLTLEVQSAERGQFTIYPPEYEYNPPECPGPHSA